MKTRRIIHRIVLFYKIVNKYCPAFLFDLLPSQVFQRTRYSLHSSINFSVFATCTERFRNSFFPSAIALWNQLSTEIRNIESIGSFKKELKIYFNIVPYNILFDFSVDRYSSVLHTRLRLDACALNYLESVYQFRIGKKVSPACLCGADHETVKHYVIKCPFYAALRSHLLTCAVTLFAERWSNVSDSTLLNSFLNGSSLLTLDKNKELFFQVQRFIIESKRFKKGD